MTVWGLPQSGARITGPVSLGDCTGRGALKVAGLLMQPFPSPNTHACNGFPCHIGRPGTRVAISSDPATVLMRRWRPDPSSLFTSHPVFASRRRDRDTENRDNPPHPPAAIRAFQPVTPRRHRHLLSISRPLEWRDTYREVPPRAPTLTSGYGLCPELVGLMLRTEFEPAAEDGRCSDDILQAHESPCVLSEDTRLGWKWTLSLPQYGQHFEMNLYRASCPTSTRQTVKTLLLT